MRGYHSSGGKIQDSMRTSGMFLAEHKNREENGELKKKRAYVHLKKPDPAGPMNPCHYRPPAQQPRFSVF